MRAHDEGVRFPITHEGRLAAAFEAAGLIDVDQRPIDVPTVFRDFDDLWTPFLRGTGPAPAYVVSLDEPARTALRDRLRASLTEEPDGTIRLTARAWAVRGTGVKARAEQPERLHISRPLALIRTSSDIHARGTPQGNGRQIAQGHVSGRARRVGPWLCACSRRSFIKLGAAGGAALFLPWRFGPAMARAQIPGGTLDPRVDPEVRERRCSCRRRCLGPASSRCAAARTSTTTRSPFASSSSRSCRPACRRQPSGAMARGLRRAVHLIFNAPSLTIEAKHRHAGPGELGQRASRGSGRSDVPVSSPTSCPWTRRSTGPIRRAGRAAATCGRIRLRRPAPTPAPFRS